MIYGDSFSVLKKTRKWIKIKIKEDGYKGLILNKILFAVTRRAGWLISSRRVIRCPGKSSGGGSATFW